MIIDVGLTITSDLGAVVRSGRSCGVVVEGGDCGVTARWVWGS